MIDKVNQNTVTSTDTSYYVNNNSNSADSISFEDSFKKEYTLDEIFDMAREKYNVP